MSAIKSRNMKPEMAVRSWLHRKGFRYRLHVKALPGKPDLVFSSLRKVIFVHGCFWHQHSDPLCLDGRIPKSRVEYWRPKLSGNVARDDEQQLKLRAAGWDVMTVWECETGDMSSTGQKLVRFLNKNV